MAGITQTIPNYVGGMSEQPDQLKGSGQVQSIINGIPDLTTGLYKRPGSKRISTNGQKIPNVQTTGAFFHYYRDETEGSYIGQIGNDGTVRMWSCDSGAEMTVNHGTGSGTDTSTNIKTYLNWSANSGTTENIQALTINDTTFVCNRGITTAMSTSKTPTRPHKYSAYIEMLKTENGRQYALNIYDPAQATQTRDYNRVNKLRITSDTLDEGDGSGVCRGIGTQVFMVHDNTTTHRKRNLIFRITVLGQNGVKSGYTASTDGPGGDDYRCAYSREVELLHGGENWIYDETIPTVTLNEGGTKGDASGNPAVYTLKVAEVVPAKTVKGYINGGFHGIIRPKPTPFDADTGVSRDTVIGEVLDEITLNKLTNGSCGLSAKMVGGGIYIYSDTQAFNVEVVENDLMRCMQDEISDVTKLPLQCVHGYIVKVINTRMSEEDDYYVKFVGDNNVDGPGSWHECADPGSTNTGIDLSFDNTKMPVVIQRTATNTFTVKQWSWADRVVGDAVTNEVPSFIGNSIQKVLFYRNRLAFLSGENLILSQPGNLTTPNFWKKTSLTPSAVDVIDISSSSTFPSDLFDAIEVNAGLLCFSTNQQFLLTSDAEALTPETAQMKPVSTYNYNEKVPPMDLGLTIGYLDNTGKWSRFTEMIDLQREGTPVVAEVSKVVPTLLPKNIDLTTNSRENGLVFFGVSGSDEVVGYKYFGPPNDRSQQAWFKWKFLNGVKYHCCINDQYFYLDSDDFLHEINLVQTDADLSLNKNTTNVNTGENFLLHIDNWITTTGLTNTYDANTDQTTFTGVTWLGQVTYTHGTDPKLVALDIDTHIQNEGNATVTRRGRYVEAVSASGTTFVLPGKWGSAAGGQFPYVGFLYEYKVDFPTLYVTKQVGNALRSDVNASLILHRLRLNLGKVGVYETTLTRVGKDDYTELHESSFSDSYSSESIPYLEEEVKTIPVY